MSLYIKWGGLALMMLSSLSVAKGYREYVARRLSEQESFISLIKHLEGYIRRYLMTPSEALSDFTDENLSRLGFLEKTSAGIPLSEAFDMISDKLSVGDVTKTAVSEIFAAISSGYKDEVLSAIGDGARSLEKALEEEREALTKNERVTSVVLVAAALGVFILFV